MVKSTPFFAWVFQLNWSKCWWGLLRLKTILTRFVNRGGGTPRGGAHLASSLAHLACSATLLVHSTWCWSGRVPALGSWSPAAMLAVGDWDGRLRMFDAVTENVLWEVQPYPRQGSNRFSVLFSPDSRFLATVSDSEENWKLWDAASGAEWMAGARHDGSGECSCSMTTTRSQTTGRRKSLDEGCSVQAHTSGLETLAFSPCGQRLATGCQDRAVIVWNAQTGKADHVIQGDSVAFSADGVRLAIGSYGGPTKVMDTTTGSLIRTIPHTHYYSPDTVQWSPTKTRTLAGVGVSLPGGKQWDADSGELLSTFPGKRWVEYSSDGRTIATACPDGHGVLLVDTNSGLLRISLPIYEVECLSFSPDGSKLATGSSDGTCKVWDSSTGALLRTIQLPTFVCCVSWGRDWVQDTQRATAFAMGHHPRLGAVSLVLGLDEELLRMILDRA